MSDPLADKLRRLPTELARWADLIAAAELRDGPDGGTIRTDGGR